MVMNVNFGCTLSGSFWKGNTTAITIIMGDLGCKALALKESRPLGSCRAVDMDYVGLWTKGKM